MLIFKKLIPKTVLLLLSFQITQSYAQSLELSLDKAIEIALQNNLEYESYKLKADHAKILKNSAFTIDNLEVFYGYDQNNVAENGYPLNIVGIEQSLSFPTVYSSQYKVNKTAISLSEKELENQRLLLIKNVSQKYYEISYLNNKEYYYRYLDTLYQSLTIEVEKKHKNGNATNLDLLNVVAKHQQILLSIDHLSYDLSTAYKKLMVLLNDNSRYTIPRIEPAKLIVSNQPLKMNPGVQYKRLEIQMQEDLLKLEKNSLLPDITLSYYRGTNRALPTKVYNGFQVGLSLPIFSWGQKSKIKAGKVAVSISKNAEENYLVDLKMRREELMCEIRKLRKSINYFATTGKKLSNEIIQTSKQSYESQEIDLFQYVQSIENAITIEMEHLDWLSKYNNMVLELNYLEM
jgi:cobalt-zinc-cadmium resistance protein CzcA